MIVCLSVWSKVVIVMCWKVVKVKVVYLKEVKVREVKGKKMKVREMRGKKMKVFSCACAEMDVCELPVLMLDFFQGLEF